MEVSNLNKIGAAHAAHVENLPERSASGIDYQLIDTILGAWCRSIPKKSRRYQVSPIHQTTARLFRFASLYRVHPISNKQGRQIKCIP
jgi:hypothetical protein